MYDDVDDDDDDDDDDDVIIAMMIKIMLEDDVNRCPLEETLRRAFGKNQRKTPDDRPNREQFRRSKAMC